MLTTQTPSLEETAENLHLVNFATAKPETLNTQVRDAINKGNQFLDALAIKSKKTKSKKTDTSSSEAQEALADVIQFEHINLALDRHWGIVSHLNSVISNDEVRHVHHELLPLLSAYSTRVGQHKPLYQCYQAIKNDTALFESLEPARKRATQLAIQSFQLSGVALPSDKQAVYADIQSRLSTLSAKFSDNILDATQAFALPLESANLAGITDTGLSMLAAAGEQYKAKNVNACQDLPTPYYVATLDIPVYLAIMTHADDRKLRETIYNAYVTRASEFDTHKNTKDEPLDNSNVMAEILELRTQKAKLLGFDNYAEVSLSKKMADNVSEVETFLRDLAEKATPVAKQDFKQLQDEASKYSIDADDVQPWDTAYLAEKVKQAKFKLSQEEIRPYFPLPTVIDGLFNIVNKLFGIRVEEKTNTVSTWQEDVRFYQLFDADNSLIGGFYFDLYARQGKRGGAWMSGFQPRYRLTNNNINTAEAYSQLPVCFMVGNFTPATTDKPSLLTHNEVVTLFHEFGHGLHHLLTQVEISDVAGVNGVEWDAVELPSQFLENWAWDSESINLISTHVDTGEPLPKDKLEALLAAKNFQSGMQTLRQIEFALFDLLLHAKSLVPDYQDILNTLNNVRDDVALTSTPDYNRFANGFSHIFAGGYAAGYYSYKWAELLSADAFSRFEEDGIFNAETGKAFRDNILSVGGSLPAKTNFEAFRGRTANIDALLRHSGFSGTHSDEVA